MPNFRRLLLYAFLTLSLAGCFDAGEPEETANSDVGSADTTRNEDTGEVDAGIDADTGDDSGADTQPPVPEPDADEPDTHDSDTHDPDTHDPDTGATDTGDGGVDADTNDVPPDLFECSIAGRDYCEEANTIWFVRADASADGDGTEAFPFQNYQDAVDVAASGDLIVIGGSQTLREDRVTILDGVSVIGGFRIQPDSSWEFDPSRRSGIRVLAPPQDDVKGLVAVDLETHTLVAGIELTSEDAADGRSLTNYGAYVVDSSNLELRNVEITAGRGGSGADGEDGTPGTDGGDGADATRPTMSEMTGGGTPGAAGGDNAACPEANGGDGGRAGYPSVQSQAVVPPEQGESTWYAAGGRPGSDEQDGEGEDGQRGIAGDGGDDGQARSGDGELIDDHWFPLGTGAAGADGEAGPGGGGGGGSFVSQDANATGTAGGGGGAGGCAGTGGEGGEAGGGSFGLFAMRSDVNVLNSALFSDAGGDGGDGGRGGVGGSGGAAGAGTQESLSMFQPTGDPVELPWRSGSGGSGGDGGDGGAGAGGAGGASYGALCFESNVTLTSTTTESLGTAAGGASPGNTGVEGVTYDSDGCR